ncbi:prolyl oligopeptidase family serine peptidase [uncultured Psychromonas sp.]|uniref:alpha/beta hydrolase family protein n=1 Tax=uncultured Psychromonas sp. TaxID=173974 RepID=UPI0026265B81|nr:prolyl oligopeptidase family serine peptidase [uncultured Psychromonas sp.]
MKYNKKWKHIILLFILFFLLAALSANTPINIKDNLFKLTNKFNFLSTPEWPSTFQLVKITSSNDKAIQNAYFLPTNEKKPLLVSLHHWSSDFTQKDPLAKLALKHNWNYIHPDFRGPNNNQQSCLSNLVISDVDDAIQYAIDNSNVDIDNIFIVGASGGGYVTLGSYLRTRHKIKRFISWVPISDLTAWYYQSISIGNEKYAENILSCTGSSLNFMNEGELKNRSPLYWDITSTISGGIDIYAGINDGHSGGGSVPISHSILFFNHLLTAWGLNENYITSETISKLLTRAYDNRGSEKKIQGRAIIYQNKTELATLTIFDGGHEIFSEYTFNELIELSD